MSILRTLGVTAFALAASVGMAAAATVNVDFNTGSPNAGTYTQNGFTFSSDNPGGASLANNCPTGSPNSPCLQFNNNEIITVTYSGGLFDVLGFLFNAPGNGGQMQVVGGPLTTVLTETQNGNAMTAASFTSQYKGLTSFSWQNVGQGSGRVDNISFGVAAVPLPATGLMLIAGIGALAAKRRRKTA